MESLKRALVLFGLFVFAASCDPAPTVRRNPVADSRNEVEVLGPEAFQFCGGWVEVWAQLRTPHDTRLLLKLSPPVNTHWWIRNANVVVEPVDGASDPIRFTEPQEFEARGGGIGQGLVTAWTLDSAAPSAERGLKVALRPFEGCTLGQEVRGVVIRPVLPRVTQ